MSDFIATMASLLAGQPAPQSPPPQLNLPTPSADTASASASTTASEAGPQLLARLNTFGSPGQGGLPNQNPLGLSPAIGGNDLGIALSGLANIRPGAGRFSAFAQGLSGALGARANAQVENQKLGLQQRSASFEQLKTLLGIQQTQREMAGVDAAANVLGGGSAPSPAPAPAGGAPMQLPSGGAPSSPPPGGAMGGTAPGPALPPSAAGIPASGTPLAGPTDAGAPPPRTAPAAAAGIEVPPVILARAARFTAAGDAAMKAGNSTLASTMYQRAATEQQRATAMTNSGKTFDQQGNEIPLPGSVRTDAEVAQAKASAEAAGKNEQAELSSPSGAKYLPPPIGYQPPPAGAAPPHDPPPGATLGGTPPTMQIDSATANVRTSIPAAPRGGGYPVPDIPQGARLTKPGDATTEQAKSDQSGFGDMVGKMPQIDQSIQRYQTLANAFQRFPSGYGQDALTFYAGLASQYGHPDLAKKILGGDPAAAQVASKESLNLALDTIKAAQPRFAQSEFNKLADKGTPNGDLSPSANHQLIGEGLGIQLRNKAFITDWQQAQQNGWQSPSAFYTKWSEANPMAGFVASAQHQIGNFKGMDLPPASDWKQGVTYVAPDQMSDQQAAAFAKRGIKPGQPFKFNGAGAQQALQPITGGG